MPSSHSFPGSNTGTEGIRAVPDVIDDVVELEDISAPEDTELTFDLSNDLTSTPDVITSDDSVEEVEQDAADSFCCEGLECGNSPIIECERVSCGTCDSADAPACIEGLCYDTCDPVACEAQTTCEESCPWETTCQEITLGLNMCATYECDSETNECLSEEGAFTGSFCVRETDGLDCVDADTGLSGVCSETICFTE